MNADFRDRKPRAESLERPKEPIVDPRLLLPEHRAEIRLLSSLVRTNEEEMNITELWNNVRWFYGLSSKYSEGSKAKKVILAAAERIANIAVQLHNKIAEG